METYEKKYKELEGKIKKAYLYAQTDSTKAVLEEILPELAESEDEWSTFPWGESVEYTRTDAFIDKAEKFFTEKFEVEDYNDNIDIDGSPIFNYGRFIEDFKKYMKGGEE